MDLRNFVNPRGLLNTGNCCDSCTSQDTCDTRFLVYAENFQRDQKVLGASYVIGVYENVNSAKFLRCLPGNIENPLKFAFSRDHFNSQVCFETGYIYIIIIIGHMYP